MANLYSILDTKSGYYGSLMTFSNDATAIRSFTEMLISGDKNSMLCMYPTDYVLTVVGAFDQPTGLITGLASPQVVINGIEAMTRACEAARVRRNRELALSGLSPSDVSASDSKDKDDGSEFAEFVSNIS
ncbi:nonstructural protein [Peromfec virus RodF8_46]|uniref:Nonstructural protein n=1 Tax=Peromfec virus RodF8_46 TaxID=2929377 RepID=A0A976N1P9_9VIRU|nr:nonstructural protein [Peromfec virus RodF8_46]